MTGLCVLRWFVLIAALGVARAAGAQPTDAIRDAERLYTSAFYERALDVLDRIAPAQLGVERDLQAVRRYRALCLLALGRRDEARSVAVALIEHQPAAADDPSDPPAFRALILETRRQALPAVIRDRYRSGREYFERKSYREAAQAFDLVLALIDDPSLQPDPPPGLADLRLLARELGDWAREAALTPVVAASASPAAPAPSAAAPVPVQVQPPAIVSQEIPPPPDVLRRVLRGKREGAVEVTIDEQGAVASVEVVTPSHTLYDHLVVAAARTWKYRPATRNGVPIPYKKLVRIIF
jgi:TonB family protein